MVEYIKIFYYRKHLHSANGDVLSVDYEMQLKVA